MLRQHTQPPWAALTPLDLVAFVSWCLTRAKCLYSCGQGIPLCIEVRCRCSLTCRPLPFHALLDGHLEGHAPFQDCVAGQRRGEHWQGKTL